MHKAKYYIDFETVFGEDFTIPVPPEGIARIIKHIENEDSYTKRVYKKPLSQIMAAINQGQPIQWGDGSLYFPLIESQAEKEKRLASKIKRFEKMKAELIKEGMFT